MTSGFRIEQIVEPVIARTACIEITATIPEWFGQPAANEAYANGVGQCTCIGAYYEQRAVGLLALRYHYNTTAEIWWLGVNREHHRKGMGRDLVRTSIDLAKASDCQDVVLQTLAPYHPDPNYAATRQFYEAMGFRVLMPADPSSGGHAMVWMIRSVA